VFLIYLFFFSYPVTLLCFSVLFLSLAHLYVVPSLWSKILLMKPNEESFYSSTILLPPLACNIKRMFFI
jgi:hypothetical protein